MADPMYTDVVRKQTWNVTHTFLGVLQLRGLSWSFSAQSTSWTSSPFSPSSSASALSSSDVLDVAPDPVNLTFSCPSDRKLRSSSGPRYLPPVTIETIRPKAVSRMISRMMGKRLLLRVVVDESPRMPRLTGVCTTAGNEEHTGEMG